MKMSIFREENFDTTGKTLRAEPIENNNKTVLQYSWRRSHVMLLNVTERVILLELLACKKIRT